MKTPRKSAFFSFLLLAPLMLSGCGGTFLSGAGSMRIEVEVYKGPLSKDPWTQVGELAGIMDEAHFAFLRSIIGTIYEGGIQQCFDQAGGKLGEKLKTLLQTPANWVGNNDRDKAYEELLKVVTLTNNTSVGCALISGVLFDLREMYDAKGKLRSIVEIAGSDKLINIIDLAAENHARELRVTLSRIAAMATRLKASAIGWETTLANLAPQNRAARSIVVSYSVLAGEFGNQMGSRADTLLLQMRKVDRRELPLSVHLRESAPTDFYNLYIWEHAFAPPLAPDIIGSGIRKMGTDERTDRVRMIERLYADHNWSKINMAYASGQGDVSMAFIKDDIGNWNLKSFSNDPGELLKAYTSVASATLSEASKLIKGISTGGASAATAGASQLLDLANRASTGKSTAGGGATVGGFDVNELHQRALDRLSVLQDDYASRQKALTTSVKDTAKTDPDKSKELQKQLDSLPTQALEQATQILREHAYLIDVLQESAAKGNSVSTSSSADKPAAAGSSRLREQAVNLRIDAGREGK